MVVCKFFQQGFCRYGQSCRFEHIYGSKYSYQAPQVQQTHQNQNTTSGVTDEQLVNQVQTDILAALKGGQWILSCYAPFKEKPHFPGISDLCPEEARLFVYEAKANNNLDQAITFMNKQSQEAKQKYEALLNPTPDIVKTLRSLYRGEIPPSPFSSGQSAGFENASATSIFRGAAQSSVFGQTPSQAQSIFAQANRVDTNTAAKSIFAQATQSVFGNAQQSSQQSLFGNQQTQSVFATNQQATQQPANVFASAQQSSIFGSGNAASPQSVFGNQNVFTSQPTQSNPSSIFASASQQAFGAEPPKTSSPFATQQSGNPFQSAAQPSNVFGGATSNIFAQQPSANDEGVYSKEDELSADDLEAFKSEKFTLGFIPELPPPRSLCL